MKATFTQMGKGSVSLDLTEGETATVSYIKEQYDVDPSLVIKVRGETVGDDYEIQDGDNIVAVGKPKNGAI